VALLLLIIRIVLAGLFATAGVAKLADLSGAEKAARGFGFSGALSTLGPIALSVAEIVLAVSLLFPSFSWYGAIGMAALLAAFIGMMVYQWSKGNAPDCHCFGQLHSEPVGVKSIVRNVLFLALAGLLVVRGPLGQGLQIQQVTAEMVPTVLGTAALIMLGGALLYLRKILATQDELRRRLDVLELLSGDGSSHGHEHVSDPELGLPIGSPLPEYELKAFDGQLMSIRNMFEPGKGVLFFFVSPTCEPCQSLLPQFRTWSEEIRERVTTVFVSSGNEKENRRKFQDLGRAQILLDDRRQFALAVGGRWTPTALYVDANLRIGSHVAAGDVSIEELIEKIKSADLDAPFTYFSNGNHHGRGLKIGVATPDFKLTDLEGREIGRQSLIGKRTLLTFWSPTCPHCVNFLDEFKEWERSRTNGDPNVILVSDGDVEEHKSLGFGSPLVLDKGYRTAAKLGMFGTPSAVLVNKDGVIETETAVGASNIWALLGRDNGSD